MNHETLKRIIFDQHQVIKGAVIIDRNIVLEKNVNYVLVGLRRAGKTTLLYKRALELINKGVDWNQIIYINLMMKGCLNSLLTILMVAKYK